MMRRAAAWILAVVLTGAGLWFSRELGAPQIWLYGAGLVGLTSVTCEAFFQQSPASEPTVHRQTASLWIAPSLLVVSGVWFMRLAPADATLPVAVGSAIVLGFLILGMQVGLRPEGRYYRVGRFAANLIVYLLAFVLFALIYHTKERSLITVPATGFVALLASLEMVRSAGGDIIGEWQLAALLALIVSETTWALNYWPASGLVGGALLLLTFYVFSGLLLAIPESRLDRRMLTEYGVVGIAGMLAIVVAML